MRWFVARASWIALVILKPSSAGRRSPLQTQLFLISHEKGGIQPPFCYVGTGIFSVILFPDFRAA